MSASTMMHASLTTASLLYTALSIGRTLYGSYIAKEREEKALVEEGVHHVYHAYVKAQRRTGAWGAAEKQMARRLVIGYVRENSSRMCACFRSTEARLVSWIDDAVAEAKCRRAQALSVALLQSTGAGPWAAL